MTGNNEKSHFVISIFFFPLILSKSPAEEIWLGFVKSHSNRNADQRESLGFVGSGVRAFSGENEHSLFMRQDDLCTSIVANEPIFGV